MQIPSYQIQNVLKVYSKQLSQGRMLARNKGVADNVNTGDNVKISAEGKRAAIVEKVAAGIVDKITTAGPREGLEQGITEQIEKEMGKKIDFKKKKGDTFSYTSINDKNEKNIKTLSVEDSSFIIKRMTQLAIQAADDNMER